jgi:Bifunctional DNA primase/polymerase, N-terminal
MMSLPDLSAPALEWARYYLSRGAAPIPVPFKTKAPVLKGWQDLRITPETVIEHFNGGETNLGLLLGAASHLIDADLDCREAVMLAPEFLPETACRFGRQSTGAAHWIWRTSAGLPTVKFEDVDKADGERTVLVELRADGAQTLFPPSVHPSGERITFVCEDFTPADGDGGELLRRVRLLAITCILARHWPAQGSRHQAALGASGLLLRAEIPLEDVMRVVVRAAHLGGDTEARERRQDVMTTYDKLQDGGVVVGGPTLAESLRGDGAAVVKRIKSWLGMHRSAEARWQPPTDRPVIDTGNLGLAEMADAAWTALEAAKEPPRIYRYGTALAWLGEDPAGRLQIEVMNQEHVRHHLAQVATFIRWTPSRPGRGPEQKPAFPPVPLAADLLAVPRTTLPRLVRVVRVPVFTADARLVTTPGFDAASGIYFAPPPGLTLPAVSGAPSTEERDAAAAVVRELLQDFPFVAEADRTHAVACLLTPFLRELIVGDVPLMVVSKPTPRTGAGLLVKVLGLVQEGAPPRPTSVNRDEEELRKKLVSVLMTSPAMVLLDNLHGRLDSAALASMLTCGGFWEDRLLGHTQTITVPVRAMFVLTGNNPSLSGEMAGRSVLIRLDPKVEDPSTRSGFLHPQIDAWTLEQRGRLLWAALTLVQRWIAAGQPHADVTFGGFESWARTLGAVLECARFTGFLANRRMRFEQADEENAQIRAFLADWWTKYGAAEVVIKELLDLAKGHALNIAGKSDQGQLVSLGRLVASLEDRRYDLGERLALVVRRGGTRRRAVLWHLEEEATCESESLGESLYATRTRARGGEIGVAESDSPDSPDSHQEEVPF